MCASPVQAQEDVAKIQTFIQNVISILVTFGGLLAAGFFVYGGIRYITSSGNPESLDQAKKTILYSAIGLVVVLGAFVLSNSVYQVSTAAFGSGQ
jgi:TRAP-type C4-dicarboxylate transport system permease small subunit